MCATIYAASALASRPPRERRALPRASPRAPPPRPVRAPRRCLGDDDKMFIPAGAFSGTTPERRASQLLSAMLTYVATWIVIAQLENVAPKRSLAGTDDVALASDETAECTRVVDQHEFLLNHLELNPVRDGDAWLTALSRESPALAARIGDVRLAYASLDFEWHNVHALVVDGFAAGNERVMREWLERAVGDDA